MKTSELIGPALDWAVAKCDGRRLVYDFDYTEDKRFNGWWQLGPNNWQPLCKYSSVWALGGPIIEREGIDLVCYPVKDGLVWRSAVAGYPNAKMGDTPLIAAMRCYVASKLGDEVEIPEGLK